MVEPNNNLDTWESVPKETLAGRAKNKKKKEMKKQKEKNRLEQKALETALADAIIAEAKQAKKTKSQRKQEKADKAAAAKAEKAKKSLAADNEANIVKVGKHDRRVMDSLKDESDKIVAVADATADQLEQKKLDDELLRFCRATNGKNVDTGEDLPVLPEENAAEAVERVFVWEVPQFSYFDKFPEPKEVETGWSDIVKAQGDVADSCGLYSHYSTWREATRKVGEQVGEFHTVKKRKAIMEMIGRSDPDEPTDDMLTLEEARARFEVSQFSNRRMTHDIRVILENFHSDIARSEVRVTDLGMNETKDFGCAPYCGPAACDAVRGITPDVAKYYALHEALWRKHGCSDPVCIGTDSYLNDHYSFTEGFNLILLRPDGSTFSVKIHDDSWETVVLKLDVSQGNHWLAVIPAHATDNGLLPMEDFKTGYMGVERIERMFGQGLVIENLSKGGSSARIIKHRQRNKRRGFFGPWKGFSSWFDQCNWEIKKTRTVRLRHDKERRTHNMAREDVECHDIVDIYSVRMRSVFGPFNSYASFDVSASRVALTLARKSMTQLKHAGLELNSAAGEVYRHMHSVNGPSESPGFITNALILAELATENGISVAPMLEQDMSGLFTGDCYNVTVPNVSKLYKAQAARGAQVGGPTNKFLYFASPLREKEPIKVNARAGPTIYNGDMKRVGDGEFQMTDDVGLAVACGGRNMVRKTDPNAEDLNKFLKFAKEEAIPFLMLNVDVSDLHEEQWEEAFRRIYKGKRTQKQIDDLCRTMTSYQNGTLTKKQARKFKRFGMFVKWESNIKANKGRPRLIMTMSDYALIKTVQVHDLLHRFYEGNVKQFQIKGYDQAEINARILELTEKLHYVTDYSSFECSITSLMRELETAVMTQLCEKAGYSETKRAIDLITAETRTLYSKTFRFSISSRCSGFPQTSAGNGIVNICVNMYCAYLKGLDWKRMDFVGEGDDGIGSVADPDIMNSVGLSLSMGLKGTKSGDCDFCSIIRTEDGCLLDVSKSCVNMLHIKNGYKLKLSKRRWLLRVKAYSTWLTSPNHPIIGALCVRIGQLTEGAKPFKCWNSGRYVNTWKGEHKISEETVIEDFPKVFNRNWGLSSLLAVGTGIERDNGKFEDYGMPPIPTATQMMLEKHILSSDGAFYFGDVLGDYSNWKNMNLFDRTEEPVKTVSQDMDEFLTFLRSIPSYKGVRPAGEIPQNLKPEHLGSRKMFWPRFKED